ncbi:MAG: HAMP domain-containing histidine kinase [Alphaproteobacteria bacterium]|nr:HAMP domain-containing histidine kinase [Alphaproteobacteria bacterium]MCB9975698.1 HAMP domain-containing histidine kinase [Rhodospirillales bacterium]
MTLPFHARIRLRTILLIVNILVFLLPLGGVMFFRVYENALVQQTENELISQAAVLSAAYKEQILKRAFASETYGLPADKASYEEVDEYYTPVIPQLELSRTNILPPRVDGKEGAMTVPFAQEAGKILTPIIIEAQKTTLSGIKILDYRGVVVAGKNEVGLDLSEVYEVRRALAGYYTSVIRERVSDEPPPALASISRGTGIRVFIALPIRHDDRVWGVVYISRTPQNILKHMYAEKGKVFFVAFILVCVALLIALMTSYLISRPIRSLIEMTERFSGGDAEALRLPLGAGVHEIELLAESFSRMALSLNNRSEYIRNFAMHVSHEFKTPITAIQGSAELLLDHLDDMGEDKRRQFLSNIIADSNRLKKLVRSLFELARADNLAVSDTTCELSSVLGRVQQKYAHDRTFEILLELEREAVVKMPAENLETVLINLCDNAVQNGADMVVIETAMRDDGSLFLWVEDNGAGISGANAAKIFTPFFTTRREEGGTGIGLGIVRSILKAYDCSIRLVSASPGSQGACFELVLKTAKDHE